MWCLWTRLNSALVFFFNLPVNEIPQLCWVGVTCHWNFIFGSVWACSQWCKQEQWNSFFFFNHQLFSHKSSKTSVVLVGIKAADELGLDEVTVSLWWRAGDCDCVGLLCLQTRLEKFLLNVSCSTETWKCCLARRHEEEVEREKGGAERWLNGFLMLMHSDVPLVLICT